MPALLLLALTLVGSYLLGAVPFGYLIARARGVNILEQGSRNIGATNVGRILGRSWGILVFVLDFANRNMAGIDFMKNLPKDKDLQVGVLDIRTSMIDPAKVIADRIRQVIKYVPADRVYLSTDCGMKPLARMVAKMKLHNLAEAAAIVRKEVGAK